MELPKEKYQHLANLPQKDRKEWVEQRIEREQKAQKKFSSLPLKMYAASFNLFGRMLKMANLWEKGLQNALDIKVKNISIRKNVPKDLQGLRVVQLSDIHIDIHPELLPVIIQRMKSIKADLIVMTGDYIDKCFDDAFEATTLMKTLCRELVKIAPTYAILGNHDQWSLVHELEKEGVTFLINESVKIHYKNSFFNLIGVDDVHSFYTAEALSVLEENAKTSSNDYNILLCHTPEFYKQAKANAIDLYLCGHTHGGQICLPGGKPILTSLRKLASRKFAKGLWNYQGMQGLTHSGTGFCALPIRFNSDSEILILNFQPNE